MLLCSFFFYFFFFKQKTAYEMRISDWSSDVCSSDLFENKPFAFSSADFHHHLLTADLLGSSQILSSSFIRMMSFILLLSLPSVVNHNWCVSLPSHPLQIGRASCRERVCQYV